MRSEDTVKSSVYHDDICVDVIGNRLVGIAVMQDNPGVINCKEKRRQSQKYSDPFRAKRSASAHPQPSPSFLHLVTAPHEKLNPK